MLSCFEKTANCEDIPRYTRTWNHPKNRELQIREIRIRELQGLPVLCHSYLLGISSKIGGEWGNMDFFGIDVLFFDDHFWQDEVDKSKSVFS